MVVRHANYYTTEAVTPVISKMKIIPFHTTLIANWLLGNPEDHYRLNKPTICPYLEQDLSSLQHHNPPA